MAQVKNVIGPERPRSNSVVVDGRSIPRMTCRERDDVVEFVLDGRMSFEFPKEWSYLAAVFAAQAMAVGAGYPHLGARSADRPFAPEVKELPVIANDAVVN